jgi:hypothetical protein
MEQAIYYTLSTIAQTLAGALAVLVAFVLFRMADLDRALVAGRITLRGQEAYYPQTWKMLAEEGPEAVKKFFVGKATLTVPDLEAIEAAHRAMLTRRALSPLLRGTVLFTASDIALCFFALPFAPRIAYSRAATWVILSLAIVLGIICLLLFVSLIYVVVNRTIPDWQKPKAKPASH